MGRWRIGGEDCTVFLYVAEGDDCGAGRALAGTPHSGPRAIIAALDDSEKAPPLRGPLESHPLAGSALAKGRLGGPVSLQPTFRVGGLGACRCAACWPHPPNAGICEGGPLGGWAARLRCVTAPNLGGHLARRPVRPCLDGRVSDQNTEC